MMDRFYIGPYDQESGLQTDVKPFVIPDQAFSELNNAYVFRGRVRKRFGSRWIGNTQTTSRLRVGVGTAGAPGTNVPGNLGAIGQAFSISDQFFTVYQANGAMYHTGAITGTFNTATGAYVFTGLGTVPAGTVIYWYPSLPVMGLISYENGVAVNAEPVYAFDTKFAYEYSTANGGWQRLAAETAGGDATWTGTNSQFFWGTTYSGANAFEKLLFVTNFNETEPNFMRYLSAGTWNAFHPAITAADFLLSARILIPFKNHLLALNTWEGVNIAGRQNYQNRLRWCGIGSPIAANAWRQDIPGNGNALDAPTVEAITTVEFVKDRLIVFFERSTWEIVYTGNQIYPFQFQQINTELGAESTFSIVPFDKVAIGVGNVGIMACNGANTERIDNKIPDKIFQIHNIDGGVARVYGIRDYFVEMIYWALPDVTSSASFPFPNKVLIYNYKTGTWAVNDDSITAFGYFQPDVGGTGVTWDSTTVTWDDDVAWDSGSLSVLFRNVIAGNQQGYTFIIDPDETTNAPVLQITNIAVAANVITITSINHNLSDGDFVYLQDITGTGNLNLLNDKIFKVRVSQNGATPNSFDFTYDDDLDSVIAGVYSGNGTISRVSNVQISTKEYNFYAKQGRNAVVQKVLFLVDKTDAGQLQVDFYVSSNVRSYLVDGEGTGALLGQGTLDTFAYNDAEEDSSRVWHPVYLQADGECIQMKLNMDDAQMMDVDIREADFELHAMVIFARPSAQYLR